MAVARLLAPLLLFSMACAVRAQVSSQQPGGRYSLRGSVVNSVTGEPVRKALVEVTGPQAKRMLTGPDGQFQFEDLPGGSYAVIARRPGFMDGDGHSQTQAVYLNSQTTVITTEPINLGPDTAPIAIKLVPLARISGRVLEADGEPVANLSVQCLHMEVSTGHKRWRTAQTVSTDNGGNFLLDDLPPGPVLVQTLQQQVYPGLIADDQASRLIYRTQYYPNAPDIGSAQTIDLAPGEDARADITASALRGTRVFFSVTPAQEWVQATLSDAEGDQVQTQVRRNIRTSGWILPSVPPGPWRLTVLSSAGTQLSGEANIDVGDSDLKNVVVAMSAPMQVPVNVSGGSTSAAGSVPLNLELIPLTPALIQGMFNAVSQNGRLAVQSVPPGAYRVAVTANSGDCLESVTAGTSDLSRADYVVAAGGSPPPINVALSTDCASLEISPAQATSQESIPVVLSGGPNSSEPRLLYTMGRASQVFTVSPGDYEIYAFSDLKDIEYANPDVLKNFNGQHVSLSPKQRATLRLDINTPGERR